MNYCSFPDDTISCINWTRTDAEIDVVSRIISPCKWAKRQMGKIRFSVGRNFWKMLWMIVQIAYIKISRWSFSKISSFRKGGGRGNLWDVTRPPAGNWWVKFTMSCNFLDKQYKYTQNIFWSTPPVEFISEYASGAEYNILACTTIDP